MIQDLWILTPEILLLILASFGLVLDLFLTEKTKVLTYLFSQISLVAVALCCWYFPNGENTTAFSGHFVADPFAQILKIFILVIMFFVFLYSRSYAHDKKMPYGEFYMLALFSILGMMLLASANTFLMIYLGLELLSLPLYALVALQRDSSRSVEAAIKYFIMGALASGMLLYGISLFYGLSGSIQLSEVSQFIGASNHTSMIAALFALVFIIVGLAFKLGAVPFHMWIPDVYQGAPTNLTLLIGSASKVAAFGMAYRILHDGLSNFAAEFGQIFIVIAVLSLGIGNVVAISQTNIKRLLGYSTIAHVGFLFLALAVAPKVGYAPAMYYIVTYSIVTAAAFGIIIYFSHQSVDIEAIADLRGLAQQNPWLAFLMLMVVFSLAGVPPTVGFYAKFIVLTALVDANLTWLAAFAVVFSIIGAYYYLRIVKTMYFDKSEEPIAKIEGKKDFYGALTINGLAVLGLGIFPAPLFVLCQRVVEHL